MTLKNGISEKQPELAKYILVVMVLGIASKLKFPFAAFNKLNVKAYIYIYIFICKGIESGDRKSLFSCFC